MLDDLVKTALIGTARGGPDGPVPAGPAGELLAALSAGDAESRLLDAVAVLSRYGVCGRTPAAVDALPPPAPAEDRPACSRRAGELLTAALASEPKVRKQLVDEWLAQANRARRRVEPALIPALLDHAVKDESTREALLGAVGHRGAWLIAMNPRWQSGLAAGTDPVEAWSTGSRDQRVAAVAQLRKVDPAKAVELVKSTWAEDGADERAAFVESMATGLADADEPFLESALDDRSKQVRAAAVDLLARLPGSAFVRRMIGRAEGMLSYETDHVAVLLPAAFDPAWGRDGLTEKASMGLGQRQWWLRQTVAMVPPAHWSAAWGKDPAACVGGLPKDFADVVLAAWDEAAARHPNPAWVAALLADPARHGRRPPRVELLDKLPAEPQQAIVTELFRSARGKAEPLMQVIHHTRFPFGPSAAAALFDQVDRHAAAAAGRYDYTVGYIMDAVALRVPPASHDGLAERWSGPAWEPYRRAVEPCLATLRLRRDIQREFEQ